METAMTAAGRRWRGQRRALHSSLLLGTHTVATASAPRPKGVDTVKCSGLCKATMTPLTIRDCHDCQ